MRRRQRDAHLWLWLLTAAATTAILVSALANRSVDSSTQPAEARP